MASTLVIQERRTVRCDCCGFAGEVIMGKRISSHRYFVFHWLCPGCQTGHVAVGGDYAPAPAFGRAMEVKSEG